ncbi:MAG: ParA family protein [Desulfobacteraceae bacterium]|nr:ParA family protein [Desulfobacteraceae bacterium]
MAQIICIAAPLAETGKTVAAVNLSAAFAVFEKKTLVVDCCPENNCLFGTLIEPPVDPPGLADLLAGEGTDMPAGLVPTRLEHLEILPAGSGLTRAVNGAKDPQEAGMRLCRAILSQAREFDFAVIDTPTAFSTLTEAALCASDELLIPLRVDPAGAEYIEEGLLYIRRLLEKIARLRREGRTRIRFAGILINCCDDRVEAEALLGPGFFEKIRKICLQLCIPEDPRLHEAFWFGKPAVCHDIKSPGACAFLDLASLWTGADETSKAEKEEDLQP